LQQARARNAADAAPDLAEVSVDAQPGKRARAVGALLLDERLALAKSER
jgi:L-amino acid N-acyltransferase YncA